VCRRLERKESALVRIPVVVTQKINFADPFLSLSLALILARPSPLAPDTGRWESHCQPRRRRGFLQSNDK